MFLLLIGLITWLPALLSTPDPGYQWKSTSPWTEHRQTSSINVDYYVNPAEWRRHPIYETIPVDKRRESQAAKYSSKLRKWETEIEQSYVSTLRNQVSTGSTRDASCF